MKVIQGLAAAKEFVLELERSRVTSAEDAKRVAKEIVDEVRAGGDVAVARSLARFDKVTIAPSQILQEVAPWTADLRSAPGLSAEEGRRGRLRSPNSAPEADQRSAVHGVSPELVAAIEMAIERIERFHSNQKQSGYAYSEGSSRFEHRVRPLRRVGIYVPGGRAVYLSTLIMCAVPARLAGVESLVVATTPRAADRPELRYACSRLGIKEVYQCGGAAGVAALALGTATLERVDKIVGPGNSFVTQAKSLLLGEVGIDMTAGPTEVVVIADESADAALVAADLLAQAEHGEDSATILITDSAQLASEVAAEIAQQLDAGDYETARQSTSRHGAILVVGSIDEAVELTNRIGPEHVEVQTRDADDVAARVDNCGAIFVGDLTPVAAGDYIAGPNHVLPTGGAARFFSPLGVYDFYKRSNLVRLADDEMRLVGRNAALLARIEGLPLHAESLDKRLNPVDRESTIRPRASSEQTTGGGSKIRGPRSESPVDRESSIRPRASSEQTTGGGSKIRGPRGENQ